MLRYILWEYWYHFFAFLHCLLCYKKVWCELHPSYYYNDIHLCGFTIKRKLNYDIMNKSSHLNYLWWSFDDSSMILLLGGNIIFIEYIPFIHLFSIFCNALFKLAIESFSTLQQNDFCHVFKSFLNALMNVHVSFFSALKNDLDLIMIV